ncbi:uncharacterized protein [Neodiprion pinetum]|uniref:uncharacterized protein isoform X1 n=2 Tax=Neodiprion pinetum TaxID=441929 RepID=UPI001EDF0D57|nr:uncharacterized protein LOC124213351 isoform X1 [Neodiprion pinetum]XP_046470559.1 uncharacterized protein LOC124213351 isoform X1 [Neodiprion pinetum]XP_046470560.1 uncharacterized protein LOC124213351 isoform X1 [Neodiprion pinetum]
MDGSNQYNKEVLSSYNGTVETEQRRRLLRDMDQDENGYILNETNDKRGNSRLRKWLIGVLICLCASLVIVNSFTYRQFTLSRSTPRSHNLLRENEIEVDNSETDVPAGPVLGFVVKTSGCRIPSFEVMDDSIKRYFQGTTEFQCDAGTHLPLVNSNLTSLFVDPKAKAHFYKDLEPAKCCWSRFWRTNGSDNSISFESTCQNFVNSTRIKDGEFVQVKCERKGKEVYKDYHAFVPRKELVENRCGSSPAPGPESGRLSVLILGLDSVSRLNFHRTMPRTVEALQGLGAVEMMGYNKVGDNTFPNLVPVLTGLSEEELTIACWTTKKKPFDDCPFIWSNFSAAGYRTVLGEDACSMTVFNYLKSGFRNQPTDYYLRPYCIATENGIGNTHKLNADLCVGTRKTFDNLLAYSRKVAREFARDSYFALFWQASLTHDFITYSKLGDESYRRFIDQVADEGLLERTALVVMSDHGIRWGSFRQTYQGYVEERLPFVFTVLPRWWREKFPIAWANFRRNSRSLTTPFDLHETLQHIMRPEELEEGKLKERSRRILGERNTPRGLSWFLPIPDHRNCSMAGITGQWCMCHLSESTSTTDPVVQQAVGFLVDELNRLLRSYPQCAVLKLKSILNSKVWAAQSHKSDKAAPTTDYSVTIQTQPGDAIFEASVRHRAQDSNQTLVGSISRLNLYGKQSACVEDFKMRLYCFCP